MKAAAASDDVAPLLKHKSSLVVYQKSYTLQRGKQDKSNEIYGHHFRYLTTADESVGFPKEKRWACRTEGTWNAVKRKIKLLSYSLHCETLRGSEPLQNVVEWNLLVIEIIMNIKSWTIHSFINTAGFLEARIWGGKEKNQNSEIRLY